MSSDPVRTRYLNQIREVLGQMIEGGEVPDESDFEHVKQSAMESAPEDERSLVTSITWDEARADLWE